MHAFILAGGFATRLWPLTEARAKPLLPLLGKPMATLILEKIPAHIPVTLSTNAAFERGFREWAATQKRPVEILIEGTTHDDHKLGALGAVAAWIKDESIDDDILLLTGDNYLGFSLDAFLSAYQPGTPLLAAYDIGDLERAKAFGTVILKSTSLTSHTSFTSPIEAFEEKPPHPRSTLISTGCSILPKQTLPVLLTYAQSHPDNIGGIFEEFLSRKIPVSCFRFSEPWMDIGSFASYLDAHRLLLGNDCVLAPDARVDKESAIEGSVSVGARSAVSQSTVTDCMIFDDCSITDCTLQNCIIDDHCVLKGIDLQNQMIRAGTRLEVE